MATAFPDNRPAGSAPAAAPLVAPPRAPWAARALVLIAALMLVAALKLGQAVVVPVLFALFLALLLSPVVELMARGRIPRVVAAAVVMTGLVALTGAALSTTWSPARKWLDTAPATLHKLETKVRPVTRFIAKVESVSTQAGQMTEPDAARREEPTPVALAPKGFVQSTQEYAITIVSMLFLTLFLLATDLPALGVRAPAGSPWAGTSAVVLRVRAELGRYFGAVTLSNLTLGVGTAVTMYALDMPSPLLWGLIAFSLNFIPYAGSATTLLLLTV
ncbi:MAG: AI-2E family transporter, partial [Steroidobacteraceae bacterium]